MNIRKRIKEVWRNIVNDESGQLDWSVWKRIGEARKPKRTPSIAQSKLPVRGYYKLPTYSPGGYVAQKKYKLPIYSPGGYIPQPVTSIRKVEQPPIQRVTQQAGVGGGVTGGGGYQPFDFSKYMSQFQLEQPPQLPPFEPTQWTPPALPAEPQVTSAMIAEWQKRARGEAGMQFDPMLLEIQQQLEKMLLSAEQAKGGLEPAYQEVIDYVKKWQEEETGATQRRYYARGLGRGGGLTEREGEIAERALKEVTAAGTERARQISDIEGQKLLAMEQAGAKKEEIEVQRGRYIAARSADLRASYEQNKTQLEQQRFTNQMQITQIGMTKEAEDFNRYLATMSMANEKWYQTQTLKLQQQSMALGEMARAEASQWEKEQFGTLSAYQRESLAGAGQMTDYQRATLAQGEEDMFTIPGTGQEIPIKLALEWGYIKPGEFAPEEIPVPEEPTWDEQQKYNAYADMAQYYANIGDQETANKYMKMASDLIPKEYTHTLGW